MERLIIQRCEDGSFGVRHGDRYADHLGGDEALFLAARFILMPENEVYLWLKTAEQHAEENARYSIAARAIITGGSGLK